MSLLLLLVCAEVDVEGEEARDADGDVGEVGEVVVVVEEIVDGERAMRISGGEEEEEVGRMAAGGFYASVRRWVGCVYVRMLKYRDIDVVEITITQSFLCWIP